MSETTVTVGLAELDALARRILIAAGTSPANAGTVAEALILAEIDGLTPHGLSRLPAYADEVRSGKVDGRAMPEVTFPTPSVVRVDARGGFAFPAIAYGLSAALELVEQTGVVAVGVANAHHCGVLGHHVEKLADRGFVGIGFANTRAAIAPWGGSRPVFGTNPVAFACPRRNEPPLVVDLSLGEAPAKAPGGAVPPIGGHKGAALALMVEVLAACVTGSRFAYEGGSFGRLFLALDPTAFGDHSLVDRLDMLLSAIVDQDGARLPGDRRLACRARLGPDGVPLPKSLYDDLLARNG